MSDEVQFHQVASHSVICCRLQFWWKVLFVLIHFGYKVAIKGSNGLVAMATVTQFLRTEQSQWTTQGHSELLFSNKFPEFGPKVQ